MEIDYMHNSSKDEFEFQALQEKIRKERGLDCFKYKSSYLKRRLAIRIRANNLKSYQEYNLFLDSHPQEYEKFLDTLTVNVTQFFRDPETYDSLYHVVIPKLVKRKSISSLKIWSAGCASGEEPYSIAIIIREALGKLADEWGIQILGTDIDPVILDKATKGVYTTKQVEGIKQDYLKKYFIKNGDEYQIAPSIKKWVKFLRENIMNGIVHPFMDIIFCRNLLIYLSKEAHKQVYNCFYKSLNEGGYLVVGNSEVVLGDTLKRFRPLPEARRLYQKVES